MSAPIGPAQDPKEDPVLARSMLVFPGIGIGASASGLAAVRTLLEGLPADTGMAVVVVAGVLQPRMRSR